MLYKKNKLEKRLTSRIGNTKRLVRLDYPQWVTNASVQLYQQVAPEKMDGAIWEQWQNENQAKWQFKLNSQYLDLSLAVSPDHLDSAFYSFWLNHQTRIFGDEALKVVRNSASELLEDEQSDSLSELKEGHRSYSLPHKADIEKLDVITLQKAASQILNQPTTLFIVGELSGEHVQKLAGQYLQSLEPVQALTPKLSMQREGVHQFNREREGVLQTQVIQYGRTPMEWSPEQAFLLSTLNPIAQQALSKKLRLELAGVYRVSYEMSLNPNTNQVESELSFRTVPDRAEELAKAATVVLSDLEASIQETNIERVKSDIYFAEESRLQSASTWLRRLMLSYRKYDDPRYLGSMLEIPELVNEKNLLKLSQSVLPMQHQIQVNTLYQPTEDLAAINQ